MSKGATIRINPSSSTTPDHVDPLGESSANRGYSTLIVSGTRPRAEYDEAVSALRERDAVVDLCANCDSLLEVSGCSPLTETTCPNCGALLKVLRDFHHFVLLSILGKGGAGIVFRAFDETLERDVALKLLRNEHTRKPEFADGLEKEALVTASISHPHVVKVYSTGRKNGYFYIAMEIVSGGSLAAKLNRQGRLPEAAVIAVAMQIAEGLDAAWNRGLLHRDVKPGNILMDEQQRAKVADFGLAMPIEKAGLASEDIWGTPEYIAPEKLLRQGEDMRSDIYSLGCTIYHCLAGTPPLSTAIVTRAIETQLAPDVPSILRMVPDVSPMMARVIERCLEKNPADRFQNYPELISTLQYARDHADKANKSLPSGQASAKKTEETMEKMGAYFTIAAIVAILAVIGAFVFRATSSSREAAPASARAGAGQPPLAAAPAQPAARAMPIGSSNSQGRDMPLAVGCHATASSVGEDHYPSNGNDTDMESRWAAAERKFPQWWKVDLGGSHTIHTVGIAWLKSSERSYQYKIEGSLDDSHYTTLVDQSQNTTMGDTNDEFLAVARYVRITITGAGESAGYASFMDCKIMGN